MNAKSYQYWDNVQEEEEEEEAQPAPKKKKPEEQKKRKAEEDAKESPVKKAKPEKKDKKGKRHHLQEFYGLWHFCLVKSYESIEDVKKAILANPGGKPKKEEKFGNWVKNTMKCSNEEWIKDLWTWHKTENKL